MGRLVGVAAPEVTALVSEWRNYRASQNDQGVVTGGWERWCPVVQQTTPWYPWPVQLMRLDFNREHEQKELPPLPWWVTGTVKPPPITPTYNYESRLITTSFQSATIRFDLLPYNDNTTQLQVCGPAEGSWFGEATWSGGPDWFGDIIEAQPSDTRWTGLELGLSPTEVGLPEQGDDRIVARRQWPLTSRTKDQSDEYFVTTEVVEWEGTVTLTHTAPLS